VVNRIAAERGWLPVITGSSDSQEQAWLRDFFRHLTTEYLDLSGRLSFQELGAVSERARCFIGVDTAPMHIAAAVGAPVMGIFGPTSERMWGPWTREKLVLSRDDLDCRLPCQNKHHCPHIACLAGLTPESVWPRIEKFLARNEKVELSSKKDSS
jgi:heptosyltransferase-3